MAGPPPPAELLARMGRHILRFSDVAEVQQPALGPGAWAVLSTQLEADHNMALVAGEEDLAALERALDGRACLVFTDPERAHALEPVLRAHGLQSAGTSPLMRLQLASTGARDPEVARVTDADLAPTLAALREAFDLTDAGMAQSIPADPGVDLWRLTEDGEVRSALVATADADVVGIYAMGTPAAHARRGLGRRLLEHALADAARAGVGWAYLGATPAGLPLYRSLGFETVAELPVWVVGSSTQFSSP